MKDATSVNVAVHLEEFKRQLSYEVSAMLEDVGRNARSRERKHLEEEITQIFAQQVDERRQNDPGMPSIRPQHLMAPRHTFVSPAQVVQSVPTQVGSFTRHSIGRPLPTPQSRAPSPDAFGPRRRRA